MTVSQPIDSQIRYILTQNTTKLEAESYTQDKFIALLSELAAATWKVQEREPVSVDAEAAITSMLIKEKFHAFLQLCVDCGFLVRGDAGTLRFRDPWLHGYLAARGLVHLLGGEYSDRGLTRDNAASILEKIGSPAIPVMIAALAAQDDSMSLGAAVVLRRMGLTAVPALIEAMSFGNHRVRRWVTEALSSKENANAALSVLLRVVQEDDRPLAVAGAINALCHSQNPEAEPALIAALRHHHPIVQTLSKQALEEFHSPRARRALDDLARPAPGSVSYTSTSREPDPTDKDERSRAEGHGRPIAITLTGGERHEQTALVEILDAGAVRRNGPGRPRVRPRRLAGDKYAVRNAGQPGASGAEGPTRRLGVG